MKGWKITASNKNPDASINLPASKSLSNRALVLKQVIAALSPETLTIQNLSDADDTVLMQAGLRIREGEIDIKNAGTCLRFLTAYYAATPGTGITINCSQRMKERPLAALVDALKKLGAHITYLEKEGFAPLHIQGAVLSGGECIIDAVETSQFASALMMVAPLMKAPLQLSFKGAVSSYDYINMTANLMTQLGFAVAIEHHQNLLIRVDNNAGSLKTNTYTVEADWSSAAFVYEAAALAQTAKIFLPALTLHSMQGDCRIADLMLNFGVATTEVIGGIWVEKVSGPNADMAGEINLLNNPDLAPPLITIAAALGVLCRFTGLASLQVKESNRLMSLNQVLNRLGFHTTIIDGDSLKTGAIKTQNKKVDPIWIETENDHRLAMCFALLALTNVNIFLSEIASVIKSFPTFWVEMKKLGIESHQIAELPKKD